ncbi:MAG: hypothetical protein JRF33_11690 [Deltaproteobacteria bacterium]|nr:hypothetical protein [Deltaproteobacteria bacterium]
MSKQDPKPKYAGIEVYVECASCFQSLPVNGHIQSSQCAFCGETLQLLPDHVAGPVKHALSYYKEVKIGKPENAVNLDKNGYYRFVYVRAEPTCMTCGKKLDLSAIEVGTDCDITCECGTQNPTYPTPDWVKKLVPAAVQFYAAERPPAGNAATPKARTACPKCGADLKLNEETRRIHRCEYCSTQVFIPNAAWTALHPEPKTRRWFVRYEK